MVRIRSESLLLAAALWLAPLAAHALEVFTCEPEWAALVKELAPQARITSATHARQDPHHIEARPALISALRRADLAVCTGASLEAGWLPMLQQRAGNPAVQDGREGMFYASQAVELIEAHEHVDRSMGDVHAEGNPHFHLDPRRLKQVAAALAQRLGRIDPPNAAAYRSRLAAWATDWDRRTAAWEAKAKPLAGRKVVVQHTAFSYVWQWLGLQQVADLEPKPGLPPTPGHLRHVLQQVRNDRPMAVVQSLYQDPQGGQWLVGQIGVPLLVLPSTVTPDGPAQTLAGLYDTLLDELLRAASTQAQDPVQAVRRATP
nr:zinc ABC transporter substrate-binding protein [uncultured Caldimonas sp.]